MIPRKGEGELQSSSVVIREFKVGGVDHKNLIKYDQGMLYLTNFRMIMEADTPAKEKVTVFELPLGALQSTVVKGVIGKLLLVEIDLSQVSASKEALDQSGLKEGFGTLHLKVEDPKTWAGQLNKAISSRKK